MANCYGQMLMGGGFSWTESVGGGCLWVANLGGLGVAIDGEYLWTRSGHGPPMVM